MDNRECYIDKHAKDKNGQPLKRWMTKAGYNNLMQSDKDRLIKQEKIKVTVPKEYVNESENKGSKSEDGQRVGNVGKRGPKAKQVSENSDAIGTDQGA